MTLDRTRMGTTDPRAITRAAAPKAIRTDGTPREHPCPTTGQGHRWQDTCARRSSLKGDLDGHPAVCRVRHPGRRTLRNVPPGEAESRPGVTPSAFANTGRSAGSSICEDEVEQGHAQVSVSMMSKGTRASRVVGLFLLLSRCRS